MRNDFKCVNCRYLHPRSRAGAGPSAALPGFRYFEDFIEDVEDNGQLRIIEDNRASCPGIAAMSPPAHTPGGLSYLVATAQGLAAVTGFSVIEGNLNPPRARWALEMEVITRRPTGGWGDDRQWLRLQLPSAALTAEPIVSIR